MTDVGIYLEEEKMKNGFRKQRAIFTHSGELNDLAIESGLLKTIQNSWRPDQRQ